MTLKEKKAKLDKKREQYFVNAAKYKKDHGKSPSWGPKKKK
jgi:hypothetical protein